MKTTVSTSITLVDKMKLARLAGRAGMSLSEAVRMIYTSGVEFFLAKVVGATDK